MPGRTDYEKRVRLLCADLERLTGTSPLQYISRLGSGESPRYVFVSRTCLGGREALEYVQGLVEAAGELVQAMLEDRQSDART